MINIIYFDQEDRLLRSVYGGEGEELVQLPTPIYGFIDDYAFVIQVSMILIVPSRSLLKGLSFSKGTLFTIILSTMCKIKSF